MNFYFVIVLFSLETKLSHCIDFEGFIYIFVLTLFSSPLLTDSTLKFVPGFY